MNKTHNPSLFFFRTYTLRIFIAAIISSAIINFLFFGGNLIFSIYISLLFLGLANEYLVLDYLAFNKHNLKIVIITLSVMLGIAIIISYSIYTYAKTINADRPLANFPSSIVGILSFIASIGIEILIIYLLPIIQAKTIDLEMYKADITKVNWRINGIYIIFMIGIVSVYLSYMASDPENQLSLLLFPVVNFIFLLALLATARSQITSNTDQKIEKIA